MVYLSTCSKEIAPAITGIINTSLRNGELPRSTKVAAVCPVYKKGDPSSPGNYRPVSLLPTTSKILEKIVLKQLQLYMTTRDDLDILPSEQSCEDARCLAIDRWNLAIDKQRMTEAIFCDMSKAYRQSKTCRPPA